MLIRSKKLYFVFSVLCLCTLSACNFNTQSIAVIDVNKIMTTGKHAQNATVEIRKAQKIYQYNLDVIIKKLDGYKNKKQAAMYRNEASQQLQTQLNASENAVKQALGAALNAAIDEEKNKYTLVLFKNTIIHADQKHDITASIQKVYSGKTIIFPPLPKKIDTPNLPADTGK